MENKLPDINLPVWMNKGEPLTLAHASKTWWERVREWLAFPLAQIDVDTCDEQLLALLAYQRDVERFPGESLSLFRLRVKYAFVNAHDAGCIAGFARIFERLGIGKIQQLERQLQYEWDVILIRINDEQLSRDNALMMRLLRQYGRTCRRYFFDVLNSDSCKVSPGEFYAHTEYHSAKWHPAPVITGFRVNGRLTDQFQPQTSFLGATFEILVESESDVEWLAEGAAVVDERGIVKITAAGSARIICRNEYNRHAIYHFDPERFYTPAMDRYYADRFVIYADSIGERLPTPKELITNNDDSGSGALWNEWGNMEAFGWGISGSAGTGQEYWSTSDSYLDPNKLGRIYVLAQLRSGNLSHVQIKQYDTLYSVVTVRDLNQTTMENQNA